MIRSGETREEIQVKQRRDGDGEREYTSHTMKSGSNRSAGAEKAAATKKHRAAGIKAASTRKANIAAKKRSGAAKKDNDTRKRNAAAKKRSDAAKRANETRQRNAAAEKAVENQTKTTTQAPDVNANDVSVGSVVRLFNPAAFVNDARAGAL